MKICPNCCDRPFPDTAITCETCGETLEAVAQPEKAPKKKSKSPLRILILTLFLGVAIAITIIAPRYFTLEDLNFFQNNAPAAPSYQVENIQFEDRFFTDYDFSLLLDRAFLSDTEWDIFFDASKGTSNYSLLSSELTAILVNPPSSLEDPQQLAEFSHTESEGYLSLLHFLVNFATEHPSLDWPTALETALLQTDMIVDGKTVRHIKITLNTATLYEMEEKIYSAELFHLPTGTSYFDLLVFPEEEISADLYLPMLEVMLDTYVPNSVLMEYNEENQAKFTACSFSALYLPQYFQQTLIPYHRNQATGLFTDEMPLITQDESLALSLIVTPSFYDEEEINGQQYSVNGQDFILFEKEITVDDSKETLITGFYHQGVLYPDLNTTLSLSVTSFTTLSQEDFQQINSIFNTIMESYEEDPSASLLQVFEDLTTAKEEEEAALLEAQQAENAEENGEISEDSAEHTDSSETSAENTESSENSDTSDPSTETPPSTEQETNQTEETTQPTPETPMPR